jgi:hypothetical protein|tara:strand:+ start:8509 stop:8769 length:261 start_codon:yes stop_codon:yes gene_type:complete
MKFYIVALMAMLQADGGKDIFVFTKPLFENANECVSYVQENQQALMYKLISEFPNDKLDRILCVPEENVEKILQNTKPSPGTSLET